MKRAMMVGAVAAVAAWTCSGALAQSSGYAHFGATSDTIRIQGNTVSPTVGFTYEMRIRVTEGSALGQLVSEQRDTYEYKSILLGASSFKAAHIRGWNCGGETVTSMPSQTAGIWRHIAWVRIGSFARLYIDGTLAMEWANQPMCVTDHSGSWMSIGMFRFGAGYCCPSPAQPSFLGDLDWIRVSSVARYTANFTPPYECDMIADTDTELLLKFNEPAGTTTLIDESDHQFVCNVGVPVAPGVTSTSPTFGNTAGGFPPCAPLCLGDIDENNTTDGVDLAIILSRWGTMPKDYPRADANNDGTVDASDLAIVLDAWGICP